MFLFLITTILGFLSVHSSLISNFILKWVNRLSSKQRELLTERAKLKTEQSKLNLTQHFVQYSRLQRRINCIEQELAQLKGDQTEKIVFNIGLGYATRIFVGVLMLLVTVYYRKTPVFIVDLKYDLTPFGGIIAFPNDFMNSVSVHFWMICCSNVAKLVKL